MSWVKSAAIAALVVAAAVPASAQQRAPRAMRGAGGHVEAALRMRETLNLNADQIARLESLRKEIVAQRQKEAVEMIELRSRVAAGNVPPDQMREQLASRRDQLQKTAKDRKEAFDKILTEDQRAQLGRMQMNNRRHHMDRGRREFRQPRRQRFN